MRDEGESGAKVIELFGTKHASGEGTAPEGTEGKRSVTENEDGLVAGNSLSAIVTMLSRSKEWTGVLGWNDFEQRVEFRGEPPFGGVERRGEMLSDEDVSRIRLWFEAAHQVEVGKQNVLDAVRIVALSNRFHPIRNYLASLAWDETPRVDIWLEKLLGVAPTSPEHERLVRAVARKWLVSCVARAMTPGAKVDSMLILEGRQGIGKSRALQALAGAEFFSDSLIDFRTKDACQNIQGVWIYELSELDALLRSETSTAKAFLTRSVDKFRAPYARTPMIVPRSTVFAGTINHGGYLKDHTGNRRFWVVRCGDAIDVDGIAAARDQLWAEARVLFERGESWHLAGTEEALMREEHEDRLVIDPWQDQVAQWVGKHQDRPFAIEEVLEGVLTLTASSRNPNVTRRVHHILDRLGFERQRRSFDQGRRVYRYVRVGGEPSRPTSPLPLFNPPEVAAPEAPASPKEQRSVARPPSKLRRKSASKRAEKKSPKSRTASKGRSR